MFQPALPVRDAVCSVLSKVDPAAVLPRIDILPRSRPNRLHPAAAAAVVRPVIRR